jgi:hypothetical protein
MLKPLLQRLKQNLCKFKPEQQRLIPELPKLKRFLYIKQPELLWFKPDLLTFESKLLAFELDLLAFKSELQRKQHLLQGFKSFYPALFLLLY